MAEPPGLGREIEERQQDDMERNHLYADVVSHVQNENLGHVCKANQCSQQRSARNDKEYSGEQFGTSGEDFVSGRRSDGSPQQALQMTDFPKV